MNAVRAEILNRIINAQKSVSGRLKFDDKNYPYLHRQVGQHGVFIRWDNTEETYLMLSQDKSAEISRHDTLTSLQIAVNQHLAKELHKANAIGR